MPRLISIEFAALTCEISYSTYFCNKFHISLQPCNILYLQINSFKSIKLYRNPIEVDLNNEHTFVLMAIGHLSLSRD